MMKKVKLSVNAPLSDSGILKKAGFHYIEPSNTDIMKMTPLEFENAVENMRERQMKCHVIDNPIPCSVSLSSKEWEIGDWKNYLELSGRRAEKLGARYWCIGNGFSRMIHEDPSEVIVNFFGMVRECAAVGKHHGLAILVEPLGPSVTNYLNNLEEVAAFLDELGMEDVYTMVDYRWEYEQHRPISDLYRYADKIRHAHIDNPNTDYASRKVRKIFSLSDGIDYSGFFDFIKSDSFSGILSIEANTFDDYEKELKAAMELYGAYGMLSCE